MTWTSDLFSQQESPRTRPMFCWWSAAPILGRCCLVWHDGDQFDDLVRPSCPFCNGRKVTISASTSLLCTRVSIFLNRNYRWKGDEICEWICVYIWGKVTVDGQWQVYVWRHILVGAGRLVKIPTTQNTKDTEEGKTAAKVGRLHKEGQE